MSKKTDKPSRLVTFGNYDWSHWLVVSCFVIFGLLFAILPSLLTKKFLWGPVLMGIIIFGIGLFCIIDHIIFIRRLKKWEQLNNK